MSVELTRDSVIAVDNEVTNQHTWPLQVTAVSSEAGLDSEMFVYHAEIGDDPYQGDVFECVAAVQQMTEVPANEPGVDDDGNSIPYFRKNVLSFHCRSEKQADDLWIKVQADVKDLLQNHRAINGLGTQEVVTIT